MVVQVNTFSQAVEAPFKAVERLGAPVEGIYAPWRE